MLAAKVHVGVEFCGVDLAGAIEADDGRVYGSIVEGWAGGTGGDVLEDMTHEWSVVGVFEEGGEGGAVTWVVEIEKRGFEVEG